MRRLFCLILLLVIQHNTSITQTELEGTYISASELQNESADTYVFSPDSNFVYKRLMHLENECGMGKYNITDTQLILTFLEVPPELKNSMGSYYLIQDNKISEDDTIDYLITVSDQDDQPLQDANAQLIDEEGYTITDKVRKSWDFDKDGFARIYFPSGLNMFGIKVALIGYESVVIPVKGDTGRTIAVKMLQLEKCSHVIEAGTTRNYYLKNIRYSGFYMREENSDNYKYFRKKKN